MRTVIIDGDILIYKVPQDYTDEFVIETESEDDNTLYRTIGWGNKKGVINYLKNKIDKIKAATGSKDFVICLSSTKNFRKALNPDYKSNRSKTKPVVYNFVRKYLSDNYNTFERENLEGDDLMGIIVTYNGNLKGIPKGERVLWSVDKDFNTVPCTFFKENKEGKTVKITITLEQADFYFMKQTLTGDSVDGYSGCKGIGAVQAQKILKGAKTLKEMWLAVVETYIQKGFTLDDALKNARCARILRAEDYDFKTKEIRLWQI